MAVVEVRDGDTIVFRTSSGTVVVLESAAVMEFQHEYETRQHQYLGSQSIFEENLPPTTRLILRGRGRTMKAASDFPEETRRLKNMTIPYTPETESDLQKVQRFLEAKRKDDAEQEVRFKLVKKREEAKLKKARSNFLGVLTGIIQKKQQRKRRKPRFSRLREEG